MILKSTQITGCPWIKDREHPFCELQKLSAGKEKILNQVMDPHTGNAEGQQVSVAQNVGDSMRWICLLPHTQGSPSNSRPVDLSAHLGPAV